jgi:hypothetical protein
VPDGLPPRFRVDLQFVTTLVLGAIVFGVLGILISTGALPKPGH